MAYYRLEQESTKEKEDYYFHGCNRDVGGPLSGSLTWFMDSLISGEVRSLAKLCKETKHSNSADSI